MQSINPWHQLHLYRNQIIGILLIVAAVFPASAQNDPTENLIDYDLQRVHYGFLIGVHNARYSFQYADAFETPALDSLHSIVPSHLPGWKVGFVIDMSIADYLSFRLLPTVGFYEHELKYRFTDDRTLVELKDPAIVELPMMLKYKSARRGNVAMYVTAGVSPGIEASGRNDRLETREKLEVRDWNIAIDAGVGFDLYFPLFKFSPEVRYSWGLRNMLTDGTNDFDVAIKRLTYQNISFYFTFEGGPTYLRNIFKKKKQ